jgi:hypothetical protein
MAVSGVGGVRRCEERRDVHRYRNHGGRNAGATAAQASTSLHSRLGDAAAVTLRREVAGPAQCSDSGPGTAVLLRRGPALA